MIISHFDQASTCIVISSTNGYVQHSSILIECRRVKWEHKACSP
jgi:hypothetical protein